MDFALTSDRLNEVGKKIKIIIVFALVLVGQILLFQNCSANHFSMNANTETSNASTASHDSNGQPYDGKIFVHLGNCPDGTTVQTRLIYKSTVLATAVRENCQTVPAFDIGPDKFSIDPRNSKQLLYGAQVMVAEQPPLTLLPKVSWIYQLSNPLPGVAADIYDIDLFSNTAATIQSLKTAGHTVLCNFSAGAYETGRPDSALFAPGDIGNRLPSSNDRWLDTRSAAVRSLMYARLDLARSKGCDGVDLDSVDAFYSNSGFPLNAATQTEYNQYLAFAAHDRNLIVALNNTPDLAPALVNAFDLVVTQQCFQNGDCAKFQPFTDLGKAVLNAEYTAVSASQCSQAKAASISLIYVSANLDGSRFETCP